MLLILISTFHLLGKLDLTKKKLPKVEFQEVDPDPGLDRSLVLVIAEKEDLGPV